MTETWDEYADRRWREMQTAWREGRPYAEKNLTVDEIKKLIEDEYRRKFH